MKRVREGSYEDTVYIDTVTAEPGWQLSVEILPTVVIQYTVVGAPTTSMYLYQIQRKSWE